MAGRHWNIGVASTSGDCVFEQMRAAAAAAAWMSPRVVSAWIYYLQKQAYASRCDLAYSSQIALGQMHPHYCRFCLHHYCRRCRRRSRVTSPLTDCSHLPPQSPCLVWSLSVYCCRATSKSQNLARRIWMIDWIVLGLFFFIEPIERMHDIHTFSWWSKCYILTSWQLHAAACGNNSQSAALWAPFSAFRLATSASVISSVLHLTNAVVLTMVCYQNFHYWSVAHFSKDLHSKSQNVRSHGDLHSAWNNDFRSILMEFDTHIHVCV